MFPQGTKCPLSALLFILFFWWYAEKDSFLLLLRGVFTQEKWCVSIVEGVRFLDWMLFRLSSFLRALTYLTFSSSTLQPGFLGRDNDDLREAKWPDYIIFHRKTCSFQTLRGASWASKWKLWVQVQPFDVLPLFSTPSLLHVKPSW